MSKNTNGSEMKICVECKWHKGRSPTNQKLNGVMGYACLNELVSTYRSPVTGERGYRLCATERDLFFGVCGRSGKLFEPKADIGVSS